MPAAIANRHQTSTDAADDLDELLNYDAAVDDFLKDLPLDSTTRADDGVNGAQTKDIDEEITIKRKRKVVLKLDENLLLSAQGIPKLRRISKHRLRFRGKGHEFSDIGRLLNMYQLWMDDMYPKAKFRDAMTMIEKLGHGKRMAVTRRAWLDESKPGRIDDDPEERGETAVMEADVTMSGALDAPDADAGKDRDFNGQHAGDASGHDDVPADDDLDALLARERDDSAPAAESVAVSKSRGPFEEDEPDEDELDALLAGEANATRASERSQARLAESEQDDLDALLSEQAATDRGPPKMPQLNGGKDDFADEEEAMAEMGGFW